MQNDDFDQHNRRENIRIYGVPEISGKKDDGEDVLFQIAEELNIELDEWDTQRCHRPGEKSFSSNKTNVGSCSKKRNAPNYSKIFKLQKKKRISVFQINAEDQRKVSKHLFNKRPAKGFQTFI